jgi:hypothetical protein
MVKIIAGIQSGDVINAIKLKISRANPTTE